MSNHNEIWLNAGDVFQKNDEYSIYRPCNDYPIGSVVPALNNHKARKDARGGIYTVCQICGGLNFVHYNGHYVCADCYTEHNTNIQF